MIKTGLTTRIKGATIQVLNKPTVGAGQWLRSTCFVLLNMLIVVWHIKTRLP